MTSSPETGLAERFNITQLPKRDTRSSSSAKSRNKHASRQFFPPPVGLRVSLFRADWGSFFSSMFWPRNVALVFAQYEEFSNLMWGVEQARDVAQSPKLWAMFGTQGPVEPGKVYGDIAGHRKGALHARDHPPR